MVITALGTAMSASYGELLLKLDREGRLRTLLMIIKGKKKYHTVETISKSWKETKWITITHNDMTNHFPGLVQTIKDRGVKLVLWTQTSPLSANAFHV